MEEQSVPDLIISANQISSGLTCMMFDTTCKEYDHFSTILKHLFGYSLELPIVVHGQEHKPNCRTFRVVMQYIRLLISHGYL